MPNTKPISDLRNYTEVLREVKDNSPVYLTRNGRGEYTIIKIEELDRLRAAVELLGQVEEGEKSARESGWISADVARKSLRRLISSARRLERFPEEGPRLEALLMVSTDYRYLYIKPN